MALKLTKVSNVAVIDIGKMVDRVSIPGGAITIYVHEVFGTITLKEVTFNNVGSPEIPPTYYEVEKGSG